MIVAIAVTQTGRLSVFNRRSRGRQVIDIVLQTNPGVGQPV
jgi:hypothetical protein